MSNHQIKKRRNCVGPIRRTIQHKKKTPNADATAAGVKAVLQISLLAGYGVSPSSASPRRRKWRVSHDLLVEVLL